jgi:GT2 family glycosyltransferase
MLGDTSGKSASAHRASDELPALSILVISYNTAELTLACLDSVVAETKATAYEIIVVDNASRDTSADDIAQAHPEVRLVRSLENLGFARANNVAARMAKGDLLLLLNPDTVVLDGAIDRLVAFAKSRPEARIWGGHTVFADGSLNTSNCWRRMDLWNLFCRAAGLTGVFRASGVFNAEAYGGWRRDTEREVDIVSGCFFLIERSFWETLGGFDPLFFMYGEEADLCLRARSLGARPRVTPDARIVHYGGASERVRAEQIIRVSRAKVSLLARHMPAGLRGAGIFLYRLWPLSRMLAYRAALLVRPGDRFALQHATWSEIWRRRREWQWGFEQQRPSTDRAVAGP